MPNKLCHLMVTFVMLKWYKLFHCKEILAIYQMTLVLFDVTTLVFVLRGYCKKFPVLPFNVVIINLFFYYLTDALFL